MFGGKKSGGFGFGGLSKFAGDAIGKVRRILCFHQFSETKIEPPYSFSLS